MQQSPATRKVPRFELMYLLCDGLVAADRIGTAKVRIAAGCRRLVQTRQMPGATAALASRLTVIAMSEAKIASADQNQQRRRRPHRRSATSRRQAHRKSGARSRQDKRQRNRSAARKIL
jgi:hypothetical protein